MLYKEVRVITRSKTNIHSRYSNKVGMDVNSGYSQRRIIYVIAAIAILSPIATYIIIYIIKYWKILNRIPKIGTPDQWIGFAGSVIGGAITMLALYFTILYEDKNRADNNKILIRPYLIGKVQINSESKYVSKLEIDNWVDNYGQIKWKIENITDNVANDVTICDEYNLIWNCNEKGFTDRIDNMYEQFGITIFTELMYEYWILAPREEYSMMTNFGIDNIPKFDKTTFRFQHVIIIQYADIKGNENYRTEFKYEININIDINKQFVFFLNNMWNRIVKQ